MHALNNVVIFLIHTLFTVYISLIIIRVILAATRADFYNPLSQFIVTITNPVLVPARKIIPSIGNIDTASWIVIFALKIIELGLLFSLREIPINLQVLIPVAVLQVVTLVITIFLYSIFIRAILSWFPNAQGAQNPVISLLNSITEPILRPIRRFIPSVGMFDLSAFVAILFLYSVLIVLRSF